MENTLQVIYFFDDSDFRSHQKLLLNGEAIHSVSDLTDCPEDAIIGRSLTSSSDVLKIIETILNTSGEFEILPLVEITSADDFENGIISEK